MVADRPVPASVTFVQLDLPAGVCPFWDAAAKHKTNAGMDLALEQLVWAPFSVTRRDHCHQKFAGARLERVCRGKQDVVLHGRRLRGRDPDPSASQHRPVKPLLALLPRHRHASHGRHAPIHAHGPSPARDGVTAPEHKRRCDDREDCSRNPPRSEDNVSRPNPGGVLMNTHRIGFRLLRVLCALTSLVWSGTSAPAAEISGVKLPDQVSVNGKSLKLNGAGLRQATILKINVYAAGLYLGKP